MKRSASWDFMTLTKAYEKEKKLREKLEKKLDAKSESQQKEVAYKNELTVLKQKNM
jgi:hypothetical protein